MYVIGGGNVIQQLLNKGLADELQVPISAVFIGGTALRIANLDPNITLEQTAVNSGAGVAHLTYRLHSA